MPIEYVSVEEAISRPGLRMVVVGGVPSPWGEAAKGILHIKRIPWCAVRLSSTWNASTSRMGAAGRLLAADPPLGPGNRPGEPMPNLKVSTKPVLTQG